MFLKLARFTVAACLVLVVASAVSAQTTTLEIKNAEVLAVRGNVLFVRGADGVQQHTIPEGFRFDMNGRQMSVRDLKPGMRLTAAIKTTSTPIEMTTTEIRTGEVLHTIGNSVVVRNSKGEIKRFNAKDLKKSDMVIYKDGKEIDLMSLRKGDKISATVITTLPPETLTVQQFEVYVQNAPKPKPKPAPVVAQVRPKPKPRPAALPKTASPLPLIGLLGLVSLAGGAGLTALRRFRSK